MIVINDELLQWFRGRLCELCEAKPGEPHHLWARGMGGGSRLDIRINLIALCRLCHGLTHAGKVARSELLEIVADREKVPAWGIEEAIWIIKRSGHGRT